MLNSNFVITLLTILATLVCLFQSEIKETFTDKHGNVYGTGPNDGLMPNGKFGAWSANSAFAPKIDLPYDLSGLKPSQIKHSLGYDMSSATKLQPIHRENFYVDKSRGVMVEANRNMQPLVGGPPRFMVTGPKLNHTFPIDMAVNAVDVDHPITDYGCGSGDVRSSTGQVLMKSSRENYEDAHKHNRNRNYEDAQVGLPKSMANIYGNTTGHLSQPVVVDKPMYANLKSRLLEGTDPIRGTPHIAPHKRNYFDVSVSTKDIRNSYIDQHNIRGKEIDEKLAFLGLREDQISSPDYTLMHGRNHDIKVTFGTDIGVSSNGL